MIAALIIATGLICSNAIDPRLCVPSNADMVIYAPVPKAICGKAMQEAIADRTKTQPIDPKYDYIKISCGRDAVGGLSVDDVGVVAPPSFRVWIAQENSEAGR